MLLLLFNIVKDLVHLLHLLPLEKQAAACTTCLSQWYFMHMHDHVMFSTEIWSVVLDD